MQIASSAFEAVVNVFVTLNRRLPLLSQAKSWQNRFNTFTNPQMTRLNDVLGLIKF